MRLPLLQLVLVTVLAAGPAQAGVAKPGFGRFGRLNEDGLLTLNVTPTGFSTAPPMTPFEVRFATEQPKVLVARLDPTEKVLRLSGGGEGSPSLLRWTLLYPGFAARFGRQAVLEISGVRMRAEGSEIPTPRGIHWILLTADSGRCMPLVIAFREGFSPVGWSLTPQGGTGKLEIRGDEDIGEVRFITPFGMREFPATAREEERNSLRAEAAAWVDRGLPVLRARVYRLSEDGRTIRVMEIFRTPEGEPISPIPPVMAFALEKGYPVAVDGTVRITDCVSKCGPFAFVEGNRLTYDLPIPPIEERAYIRVPDSPERVQLLNGLVGHLGGEWATNAVDLAYAGMANAQMAWAYLGRERRQQLAEAWSKYLPEAFRLPPYAQDAPKQPWQQEAEPFSGHEYVWTYALTGPPPNEYRLDIEWGNALPLYGLQKYAQYTGDWDFVRATLPAVARVFAYLDLGDDWAWMTTVNGDMGYSTGTGDPLAANYAGHVACLRMARAIGDRDAEEFFAYRAARVAVPAVARLWYTDWARERGFIPDNAVVLGFWERSTFTHSVLDETAQNPWGPTSFLSGDGILPEFFALLDAYARPALERFEREYAAGYPHWADGSYQYQFDAIYGGNSIYVTFPHIYARALLGEPAGRLWGYVDSAVGNRGTGFWVAPNVLAELLSRDAPLVMTEWQPAAYRDGFVAEDGKTAVLQFATGRATRWAFSATVRDSFEPQKVILNGRETAFRFQDGILRVSGVVENEFELRIEF